MRNAKTTYDVLIAGAGPAGSSLAIRLAGAGLKVALTEQKKFPRHKLCGEFVSPECVEHFAELGLTATIESACRAELRETVFYSYSGRSVSIRSDVFSNGESSAIGLSRSRMDELLFERAHQAGAEVLRETTASRVIVNGKKVMGVEVTDANGNRSEINARLTIDGTGRSRQLVRMVMPLVKSRPTLTAFKTHLAGAEPDDGACEIYSYPGGYGGLNSVGDRFNLCFVVASDKVRATGNDPELLMREIVMRNPRAAQTLRNARAVEPWLAVAIDRFGTVEPAPVEGLISIGDAASFIDPFTGSGMLMALESSRVAASVIPDNIADLSALREEYLEVYGRKFAKRLRYSNILRFASSSTRVGEIAVAALRSSRSLRAQVARHTRN